MTTKNSGIIKIDGMQLPPGCSLFTPEEKQRFCSLVHDLRKQGFSLEAAQELAYSRVLCDDTPFEPAGR